VPTGKESIAMSIFPTTILLATDGSQDAELARTTAVDMATTTDSELHVVSVAPRYPSVDYSRQGARSLRGT
jgi:nucleotide-binding universal stress UspA family protein